MKPQQDSASIMPANMSEAQVNITRDGLGDPALVDPDN